MSQVKLYKEYRENPGKPELVLLHGWGMTGQVWGPFADQLAEHFSLTIIDLPGLGRSQEFPTPYTLDAVLDLLVEQVPESAIWLGWSMGGQIAVAFADRFPARVDKLITIASNPCFVQRDDWPSAMDEVTHQAFEASLAQNQKKTLTRFIMLQTQGAEAGREILKALKKILSDVEHTAAEESLALLRLDQRPELKKLALPVLHLFGEVDHLVPNSAAEACKSVSGGKVVTYTGAGHLPFLSHQADVVADILGFVQGDQS
ncbi:pimeloyl-ACP methyl ester esterase BioH [Neptuniibacter sp. PT34_22]|uniref:pimeloyl-ACP methyl ester esterase BioH n=1 Tax=Neptuniibacter sp. PT34_22 TaxID=3398205 RepID=UPI0039F53F57